MLINKRSIYRDRKLRIKYNLYEKKKKIYKFISRDLSKNILIFLKKKHLKGLTLSLQDKLFMVESNLLESNRKSWGKKKLKIEVASYKCDSSKLNNICSVVIFDHFSRLYKRIEKKKLFFATRKVPTAVKINNRCLLTGTSRSVYRRFKIGRQALKKQINDGLLPSFTKTSF